MMYSGWDPFESDIQLLTSIDQIHSFMEWVQTPRERVSIDTETDGFDWYDGTLRLFQIGDRDSGWAIPFELWQGVIAACMAEIDRQGVEIIFHNASFDIHWIEKNTGWYPPNWGLIHDTQLIANLVDFGNGKDLKGLSVYYVHPAAAVGQKMLHDMFEKHGWTWGTVPIDLPEYWWYGVMDVILTVRLFEILFPKIKRFGMEEAYAIEQGAAQPLYNIERHGMLLDSEYSHEHYAREMKEAERIQSVVLTEYGLENIGSGDQVAQAFQGAGIQLTAKTKTGKWKTDRDTLELITVNTGHPLAKMVSDYRKRNKYASYYSTSLEHQNSDGRCHGNYRQMQARTHRMSVTAPAIQTYPRTSTDPYVRNAFLASEGTQYVSADYSNLEARYFAHASGDPVMIEFIKAGGDLHALTAMKIFKLDAPAAKDSAERQVAKNGLFAALFVSGPKTFAITAGIPVDHATKVLDGLYETYPRMRPFQREIMNEGQANKDSVGRAFVTLPDGRQVGIGSNDDRIYSLANYAVQGPSASVMKRGLANAQAMGLGSYMVACVHDEILMEVPDSDVREASETLEDAMSDTENYKVPLLAVADAPAARWGGAH